MLDDAEISRILHDAGGLVYIDGANMTHKWQRVAAQQIAGRDQ